MAACMQICGDLFSGMQTQARKTRTYTNISNTIKGSNPPPSASKAIFSQYPLVRALRIWYTILRFHVWGSSSVGRASRSQRGGREFESLLLHHSTRQKTSGCSEAFFVFWILVLPSVIDWYGCTAEGKYDIIYHLWNSRTLSGLRRMSS